VRRGDRPLDVLDPAVGLASSYRDDREATARNDRGEITVRGFDDQIEVEVYEIPVLLRLLGMLANSY